jgi:hypothetical protein
MKQLLITILVILAIGLTFFIFRDKESDLLGDVHEHADFRVYLNGEAYDFSQEKYLSIPNNSLSNFIHLHDKEGNIIGIEILRVSKRISKDFLKTVTVKDINLKN